MKHMVCLYFCGGAEYSSKYLREGWMMGWDGHTSEEKPLKTKVLVDVTIGILLLFKYLVYGRERDHLSEIVVLLLLED